MQFIKLFQFLVALAFTAAARFPSHGRRQAQGPPFPTALLPVISENWTDTPLNGSFTTQGFGQMTNPSGSGVTYKGNVGNPWGSNIIEISESNAPMYKHVTQFTGQNTKLWTVVFWNKFGPDGMMNGWFGHSALTLSINPGDVKYVAFQDDSQGGWSAAPGNTIPTDNNGGYAATWGEFDFSSAGNNGWSGFDVSVIQPQSAGIIPQGMQICQVTRGSVCSSATPGARVVDNAYTVAEIPIGGIGGNIAPGPVRLVTVIDYRG